MAPAAAAPAAREQRPSSEKRPGKAHRTPVLPAVAEPPMQVPAAAGFGMPVGCCQQVAAATRAATVGPVAAAATRVAQLVEPERVAEHCDA